jgi:hypothetical protein
MASSRISAPVQQDEEGLGARTQTENTKQLIATAEHRREWFCKCNPIDDTLSSSRAAGHEEIRQQRLSDNALHDGERHIASVEKATSSGTPTHVQHLDARTKRTTKQTATAKRTATSGSNHGPPMIVKRRAWRRSIMVSRSVMGTTAM